MADEDEREAVLRRRAAQVGVGVACGTVAVAAAVFGWAGLLVAVSVVAVVAGWVALAGVPAAPLPRRRSRPGPPVENAPFRSFRTVSESLSWAAVSPRHYDLVTRPMLQQVLVSRLADRHRIDVDSDPAAARALVGEDVWHWLDPAREVTRQGQPPGVDLGTLTKIVDRLETL